MNDVEVMKEHEAALQRCVTVWIVTGLVFMLLPGTFLGAWNLISISHQHDARDLDPAWIQAHGHAQIFGWVGAFILGIGYYSLSKMRGLGRYAVGRAWTSWILWTTGVGLRWITNLWGWQWRLILPLSAVLELAGFFLFFLTVRGHRSQRDPGAGGGQGDQAWIGIVIAGTLGFLLSLLANLGTTLYAALAGRGPAIPGVIDQRLLPLFTWGFLVVTVWGFSTRWLPVFLGLSKPDNRLLRIAVIVNTGAVVSALVAWWIAATGLFALGAAFAFAALHMHARGERPPKVTGVHPTFPLFVRMAYVWLLLSSWVALGAALWDQHGGVWGASRHALTVGFISAMVFAIGQRVLPAFCGMKVLFSPTLMFLALLLLNLGCFLRVGSEIGAYEGYLPALWGVLPVSAVIEISAVTLFAANLLITFLQAPPHLRSVRRPASSTPQ